MNVEDSEDTEVPLSNIEVLKVLKARPSNSPFNMEIIEYLEKFTNSKELYSLEILRNIKNEYNLDADITKLAIVSNTQDISILSSSDKKRIEQYLSKNKKA